ARRAPATAIVRWRGGDDDVRGASRRIAATVLVSAAGGHRRPGWRRTPAVPIPTCRPLPTRARVSYATRAATRRRGRHRSATTPARAVWTSPLPSAPSPSVGPAPPRPAAPVRRVGDRAVVPRARCRTGGVVSYPPRTDTTGLGSPHAAPIP